MPFLKQKQHSLAPSLQRGVQPDLLNTQGLGELTVFNGGIPVLVDKHRGPNVMHLIKERHFTAVQKQKPRTT